MVKPLTFNRAKALLEKRMEEGMVLPEQKRTLEYLEKFSPKEDAEVGTEADVILHNLSGAPSKTQEYAKKFWGE